MQVAAEKHFRTGFTQQGGQRLALADHIAEIENRVFVQILVSGGDHPLAGSLGSRQLLLHPGQRVLGQTAGLLQGVGIQHQQPGPFIQLSHIADGIPVPGDGLVKAETGINPGEILGSSRLNQIVAVPLEARRIMVIHIVVPRQHIDRHPRRLHGGQLFRQGLVTFHRAVEAQIPGEDQGVRLLLCHLRQKGIHQLLTVIGDLAVSRRQHLGEKFPLIRKGRGQIVQVRGGDQLQLSPGLSHPGAAAEQQYQCQTNDHHPFRHKIAPIVK